MKKIQKFDIFDAFLYPKRPKSKIQKNRKKCIFFKKSNFFKGLSGHHRCSEMVQNSPPKCSKHISNQYLMFTSILDHFLKNRKKSIFEKNFSSMHQQNWPNLFFPAEYRPNIICHWKNILRPLSEKNLTSSYWVFWFLP